MRFRFFLFSMLGVYALVQGAVVVFMRSAGVPWTGIGPFLLFSLSMPVYLNLAFAKNWPRPIWLMPVFFSYYFVSSVGVLTSVALRAGLSIVRWLHPGSAPRVLPVGLEIEAVLGVWSFFLLFAVVNRILGPRIREVPIVLPGLSPNMEGLRILQVSDVHVGLFESDRSLRRLKEAIEKNSVDLLVFTGDMIDRRLDEVDRFLVFFGGLKGKLGVFSVMGNHEHWVDGPAVAAKLSGAGWPLLENTSVSIAVGGGTLHVAGLTDPASRERGGTGPSPEKAFAKVSYVPGDIVVVLSHHPSLWNLLSAFPAQLTLSGHTHGGQIGLPFQRWNLSSLFYDYDVGLFRRVSGFGTQYLYVNPGTGYFGVPIRFGVRSEITLFIFKGGGEKTMSSGRE